MNPETISNLLEIDDNKVVPKDPTQKQEYKFFIMMKTQYGQKIFTKQKTLIVGCGIGSNAEHIYFTSPPAGQPVFLYLDQKTVSDKTIATPMFESSKANCPITKCIIVN